MQYFVLQMSDDKDMIIDHAEESNSTISSVSSDICNPAQVLVLVQAAQHAP